jgi:hypothetical protein
LRCSWTKEREEETNCSKKKPQERPVAWWANNAYQQGIPVEGNGMRRRALLVGTLFGLFMRKILRRLARPVKNFSGRRGLRRYRKTRDAPRPLFYTPARSASVVNASA